MIRRNPKILIRDFLHRLRVYPLGEDIPRYPASIFFLVLVQVLLAQVQELLAQALPSALLAQVLQALQALPSALLVSAPAAVIDCSPT